MNDGHWHMAVVVTAFPGDMDCGSPVSRFDLHFYVLFIVIIQVPASRKLPIMYLIDSIIKNLPKTVYPGIFANCIVDIFCGVFEEVVAVIFFFFFSNC